ncbi:MAG: MutS-related protein [Candidatus Promineifilaceae bacterium]
MTRSEMGGSSRHERRLNALRRQIGRLDRCLLELEGHSERISRGRLITFILLLALSAAALLALGEVAFLLTGLVLLTLFIYLVYRHRRIEATAARLRIWRQLRLDQIARMMLDWDDIPPTEPLGERFEHPFGRDLDIVGERSLQRVIDLAITVEGSGRLRQWLLEFEPDLAALPARQSLVRELMRMPALTTRLTLNALLAAGHDGSVTPERWSSAQVLQWLAQQNSGGSLRTILVILLLMVPINFALLLAYLQEWLPPLFLLSWFIYGAIAISQLRHIEPVFHSASFIIESLRQLQSVFAALERRSFSGSPSLSALTEPLRVDGLSPSEMLARTNRLLAAAGLRYNPFVAFLINAIFPLDVLVAYRLDSLKAELADVMPGWLAIWHQLEALGSLANFGYLYPGANFADIRVADRPAETPFSAAELGHPLIETDDRVYNDFTIDRVGTIVMITGSNMAGKSTFLRTLGINVRLALSGAPVLARSLSLIPLRVFASITVTDSVTDGFSFFYAEVRRLKMLLDCLHETDNVPLFFLIDEIFRGTNNRERLTGSHYYVDALIGENGCGAIATHDLELVKLALDNPAVSNYHFRDDVIGGRMVFDYKIHPGPCPTTNALRIMRLAGLPVGSIDDEGAS